MALVLPVDPIVPHVEVSLLGFDDAGHIYQFIVAILRQAPSVSLLKLAVDQKLLVGSQLNQ